MDFNFSVTQTFFNKIDHGGLSLTQEFFMSNDEFMQLIWQKI